MIAAALIAACEVTPTTAPSASLPTESQPAPSTKVSPAATAGPSQDTGSTVKALGVTAPAPPTTSVEKIQAAVEAGAIDDATAYLFRAYAQVGDPRLPEAYRGLQTEDDALWIALYRDMPSLPQVIQEQLLPYFVRPTDPRSVWNEEPAATAQGLVGAGRRGRTFTVEQGRAWAPAFACSNGWIRDRVSSTIPITLWSQCGVDQGAANTRLEEARTYLVRHWLAETNLMGFPIGDANDPNDDYPDPPEGDDGLVDIYLLANTTPTGHPRTLTTGGYASVRPTAPLSGPAGAEQASAYMVVGPGLSGLILEATLVHELFHVLQASHNVYGRIDCPPLLLRTGCSGQQQKSHWFVEASAAWSEHEFVPAARPIGDGPYDQWKGFISNPNGLWLTDGSNEYNSWMWPLFMEQEWDADIVGNTWRAIRADVGWFAVQATIDQQLSFEQRFDDFAVRVFNRVLPGNPVDPRFRTQRLDPTFPNTSPTDQRYIVDVLEDLARPMVAATTTYSYTMTMNSLWSAYLPIEPPPGARQLKFEFAAFAPEIEIDAIVRVGDAWQRRELPAGETVWCLDNPADAVEEGFLIFSNHEQVPGSLTRPWTITAEEAGCGNPVGTIRYSFLDTTPMPYAGSSLSQEATIQVRLKRNTNIGEPSVAEFVNDGSTYGVQSTSKVVFPPGVDGCSPMGTSIGTPGGTLAIDSVVGNTRQDENGDWLLSLGITLPITIASTEDWCAIGSNHFTTEGTVVVQDCEGKENADVRTPSTRTFIFDCDFQGPSQAWGVSGILIINW